ncbi:RNA-binding protein [bacterium]|nr:RNA-binding protein [bacterium]
MKIYIGNMSFDMTEDDLRQTFESFGEVSDINIIMDRDTGRPRGFAFVEMPDSGAASSAIADLNGKEIGGRRLTVNEAKPRNDNRGGGGGGFRKRSW